MKESVGVASPAEPIAIAGVLLERAWAAGLEPLMEAAVRTADDGALSAAERVDMLVELANGLQQRPKTPAWLLGAIELYDKALALCGDADALLTARITARKGTALQAIPGEGSATLQLALSAYETAMPELARSGTREELAEAEMNRGLVLQQLAGAGRARITDAIAAYHRALRTFDAAKHPVEFAILQNNLATAFLSISFSDERSKVREALAVQCFEAALKAVNLIDHPAEYAMLQNNLGNALQYASSAHQVENNLRALEAYDEALRVRTRRTSPIEYANTIANKANCLSNLPDDAEHPEGGNPANLRAAKMLYDEASEIFASHGNMDKARLVMEAAAELGRELLADNG